MKTIVGLGNPGPEYEKNRHNVGFMFADFVRHGTFAYDKYLLADTATISLKDQEILIAKPQTFMNRSGDATKKIIMRHHVKPSTDLFVAHDDLDIPLGKFKIQLASGPKLHNGLESIEHAIGSPQFWRIRIGVENRTAENRIPGEKFVLQNFTSDEKQAIREIFPKIYARLISAIIAS